MKKFLLSLFILAATSNAFAAAAVKTTDPKVYAKSISSAIVEVIQSDKSEADKFKNLETVFKENVDTDYMGKFALGRYFKSAKPALQKKYLGLYRDFVMYSYVPKFKNYANQNVQILSANKANNGEYVVKTKLKPSNGEVKEILLDYRIVQKNGSFRVIDIIGEGVSYITNQRSDFGGALSQMPIEKFVGKLEEKVAKLKKNAI